MQSRSSREPTTPAASSAMRAGACSACIRTSLPRLAMPTGKLVDWMLKFQFDDGDVDYFELDPVAYAPALGEAGMRTYRKRLDEIAAGLGPRPSVADQWRFGPISRLVHVELERAATRRRSITTSTPSSEPTPRTAGLRHGSRTRPRRSRRSARSTSRSTGRSRPRTSTEATSRSRRPTTGAAASWRHIAPPTYWKRGSSCFGGGRRQPRPHDFTTQQEAGGPASATK